MRLFFVILRVNRVPASIPLVPPRTEGNFGPLLIYLNLSFLHNLEFYLTFHFYNSIFHAVRISNVTLIIRSALFIVFTCFGT